MKRKSSPGKTDPVYDAHNLDLSALPNEPQIDRYLNKYMYSLGGYLKDRSARREVPGFAVAVRTGERIVHLKCYGYANLETKEKVTPNTLFDLGSLSKQFTAYSVLGLVLTKQLHPDDKISKFFKSFPVNSELITVKDLIHHTAALPEYFTISVDANRIGEDWYKEAMATADDWYPKMLNRKEKEHTNRDVVRWIASQRVLPGQPGESFEYSNSGYVVLAELVKRITKMRFADYLREGVFDPLGMKDTFLFDEASSFASDAREVLNHAKCYNRVDQGFIPIGYTPLNFIYGDGNIHSTILDMAKWDLHLHRLSTAAIFSKDESQEESANQIRDFLWAPARVNRQKKVHYGAGWYLLHDHYEEKIEEDGVEVTRKYESRAEHHRGEWLGWRSYIARGSRWLVPEEGQEVDPATSESLGIVVLTNNSQLNTCRVAKFISRIYWGERKRDNIMNRFNCD